MKSSFFVLIAIVCFGANGQTEKPQLRFGCYTDRCVIPLSFRSTKVDYVRLTNSVGDSCLNYQIISGILEYMEDGSKEMITENGFLSETARHLIRNARAGIYKIAVYYKNQETDETDEVEMKFSLGITPELIFGNIANGDTLVDRNAILDVSQIFMGFSNIPDAKDFFVIRSGSMISDGLEMTGSILSGGFLDQTCLAILQNPNSRKITLTINWADGNNIGRKSSFWFKINA